MSKLSQLVDVLLTELVSFEPDVLPGGECVALAEQLARASKACEAASVRAAARGVTDRPVEFLARVSGSTTGAARTAMEAVEEARSATRHALMAGEVSVAQAAVIVSAPGYEAELLEVARAKGLGPVRDAARKCRVAAIDPEELHQRQVDAQRFRWWRTDIGNIGFTGELPPEVGVPFVKRVDTETDRVWRASPKAERAKPREWHAARGLAKLLGTQRRGPGSAADLVIVCDLNAYRRGQAAPGEACHIVGGGPIPVALAREIGRDAFLKAVLHDGVNIHTVAHFGRYRPAVLQTALDVGAPPTFEGVVCTDCGREFHLQWDHVDPVANGGPTAVDNLEPRCPPCHTAKTERDRLAGLLRSRARAP